MPRVSGKELKQLYDDFVKVVKNHRKSHFFGSIVSSYQPNGRYTEYLVIDGQQRLTTVSLLFLAMYSLIKEGIVHPQTETMAQEIFEDYLVDKHQPKETRVKLKPVKNDRSAFEKLFNVDEEKDKKSNLTYNSKKFLFSDMPPITLITGKEWSPSEKELLQWSTSYPDADLLGELRCIEDWFQKHPDRRKTERGMHTFVKVWLDQKKSDDVVRQHSTNRGRYQNAFNDFSLRQEYDFEELEADLLSKSGGTDTNELKQTLDHGGPK